ncbi:MAG: carotenoid oxygenase family protein [Actinomycetota bacterium]
MKTQAHVETIAADPAHEDNPYLAGIYAPVHQEVVAEDLEVVGEIPHDLNGVYIRNGPNPAFAPRGRYHWFDGDGMLHAVRFQNGSASYRNRWIRTRAYGREQEAGGVLWSGIMEPLTANPKDLPMKDSANTDIVYFRNRVLALWYLCGEPYEIHPLTLDTDGAGDWGGTRLCTVSAHAKVDELTGELFFFDYGPRPPYMRYGVVGPAGSITHFQEIALPGPRLPHDMAITQNYAILMDLPLVNDPQAMREGRHKIVFDRGTPARFGVIGRHGRGDQIRWFEASPCYVYHSVNAWEEGDEVVLDVCRVTRPAPPGEALGPLARMLAYLRLDAQLYRYRFDMRTGATREEYLDDEDVEFPTMNLGLLGKPSRYAYTMRISPNPTFMFDGIVKYDMGKQSSERYPFGEARWGSEAPFAPRPNAVAEDDGYLVSFVHDENTGRSEVVILDAANIAAGPVGRVLLPVRVPLGFHALWVREDQLGSDV